MFKIVFVEGFEKYFKKIIQKDPILVKKFYKTTALLSQDPNYPSLQSHKVDIIGYDDVWVSWVSDDVRLVWSYDEKKQLVINCLKLGTHGGANNVYFKKSN
jgi:mRNA-degrading endonuclease YafQ of YafQ-DinJ toxin-antitoxin module